MGDEGEPGGTETPHFKFSIVKDPQASKQPSHLADLLKVIPGSWDHRV